MLLQAGRIQYARLEDALKAIGLSAAKYYVLSQLAKSGEPVPLRLLAAEQECVPSNMTTLVDRPEADGLVRRIDDPSDRRRKRAILTPLGEEKAAAGAEVVAKVESAFAESLGPTERLALATVLRNPVVLTGLRRDMVTVGAGTFSTTVVRPTIRTTGIFSGDGQAQVWFTDDASRYPVQVKAKFAKFTLTLSLQSVNPGVPSSALPALIAQADDPNDTP